jgi:hypothetical protein
MPSTENNRRNLQQPVLEQPSLPDHDRTKDQGMHEAHAVTIDAESAEKTVNMEPEDAAPDQAFEQMLASGPAANAGKIPSDPNNWLTSDPAAADENPEDRGVSLPDIIEGGND